MIKFLTTKSTYIRIFTPLVFLLSLLIIFMIFSIYNKTIHVTKLSKSLSESVHNIVYYDEVLTMSSRMAVLTGDKEWIQRYNDHVVKLDIAIKNSIDLVPEITSYLDSVDKANQELISMEVKSFELLEDAKQSEAKDLLFSQKYLNYKKIYDNGIKQSIQLIQEKQNIITGEIQSELLLSIFEILILLAINLYFARVMLRYLSNYNKKLHQEIDQHIEQYNVAQQKVLQEGKKAQTYLDLAGSLIVALDKQGNVSLINKYGVDLLEATESEIVGRNWFENFLVTQDVEVVKNYFKTIMEGDLEAAKYTQNKIKTSQGNILEISWHNSIIYEGDEVVGVLSSGTDITKQKEYENSIIKAKELANLASQAKSEFLANMSHEIRTPMNGILGFVDHLAKTEKDPQRVKVFDTIQNSGKTLLGIINDILDFSKIEDGKLELEKNTIDLYALVDDIVNIFSQSLENKNLTFNKKIDTDATQCIIGDEIRFKQILLNLIGNAIKFTPENGSITLEIQVNKANNTILISIIDTGIGIADDKLEKIFDAFGQEDTSTTRKYGGTGLGLTISSKLIKLMGGELQVQSKLGEGSKFYFTIPLENCVQALGSTLETEIEESQESRFNAHVLIVEDNKTNQMLMSMILDDLGVTYDIANDGVEALEKYSQLSYDLIFMDENMPNMNGIEATKQIREKEQTTKNSSTIIAVTANALSEDRQRFLDAGMNDYIAKPYTEEDIVAVLRKYLA